MMSSYWKYTYWNKNGEHQVAADLLSEMIPHSGKVNNPRKNKALEKFRKARNCYYDLYNNGLCNRSKEFREVFGLSSSMYKMPYGFDTSLYIKVEAELNRIIVAAAEEQGIRIHYCETFAA